MEDKKLVCKDCGQEFVWTVGEQEFYQQKGLTNEPKRCPACRRARKAQQRPQFVEQKPVETETQSENE